MNSCHTSQSLIFHFFIHQAHSRISRYAALTTPQFKASSTVWDDGPGLWTVARGGNFHGYFLELHTCSLFIHDSMTTTCPHHEWCKNICDILASSWNPFWWWEGELIGLWLFIIWTRTSQTPHFTSVRYEVWNFQTSQLPAYVFCQPQFV